MSRLLRVFGVLGLAALLAGCVDYRQRIVLQPDGSGTVEVRLDAPKDVNWEMNSGLRLPKGDEEEICAEIEKRYSRPHVRVESCEVRVVDNRRKTRFTLSFDNLEDLSGLDLMTGKCTFQLRRNGGLEVRRVIDLDDSSDWESDDTGFAKWVKERLDEDVFSKIHFRFEIVFPERVEETNADWVRGKKVAVWRYTLADLVGRGKVIQFAAGK
ncbi:MAG: hypothetical protein GXO73_04325 [Calditrichaeota bacterium]|nr:hypothetical protein [Calditrichota bacterium]